MSVRHGASVPYVDVRQRCESAPHLLKKGPGFVLYALMDFVVDNYFPIVDELEEELEKLEEEIFGGNYRRETTETIYDLKRDLLGLKRAVSPLIDICNRLTRFACLACAMIARASPSVASWMRTGAKRTWPDFCPTR